MSTLYLYSIWLLVIYLIDNTFEDYKQNIISIVKNTFFTEMNHYFILTLLTKLISLTMLYIWTLQHYHSQTKRCLSQLNIPSWLYYFNTKPVPIKIHRYDYGLHKTGSIFPSAIFSENDYLSSVLLDI